MKQSKKEKVFLTYNQQLKHLRDDKKILCSGSPHKKILIRYGYFNIINGYKDPFVTDKKVTGEHIYYSDTSINQIFSVKNFDDNLRNLILSQIVLVEEELRTLTGYKFDQVNNNGKTPWYHTTAYDSKSKIKDRMNTISKAYTEINRSSTNLEYVDFYMNNHNYIPTWIMIKVINFSTFIDVLKYSKQEVKHAICELYDIKDSKGLPNTKLLIGSLHWIRKIRNACAHNERIYSITYTKNGRILENYFSKLPSPYNQQDNKYIFDLFVYLKYYLPSDEYRDFISKVQGLLFKLRGEINEHAFDYIRGHMGIKQLDVLNQLAYMEKKEIDYNKFDRLP